MLPIQDHLTAAARSNVASQFTMMAALIGKSIDGAGQLYKLNMAAARASMEESNEAVRQLLAAREPREALGLSIAQVQPNIEKAMAYSRHVANIASATQAEFINAAEVRFEENRRHAAQLIDDFAASLPAGSQGAADALRSLLETTQASYEQVARAARQTMTMAGGTLDMASQTVHQTMQAAQPAQDAATANAIIVAN